MMRGAPFVERYRLLEPLHGVVRLTLIEQKTTHAVHRGVVVGRPRYLRLKLRLRGCIVAIGDQQLHRWIALSVHSGCSGQGDQRRHADESRGAVEMSCSPCWCHVGSQLSSAYRTYGRNRVT